MSAEVIPMPNPMLAAALSYAARGWHVFPLAPRSKKPFSEKHGLACAFPHGHGLLDATTDEAVIRGWWAEHPTANVGIRTGAESGIFVFDVDPRNGGTESFMKLQEEHGRFPDTMEVKTPSGGSHFYFKHPGGYIKSAPLDEKEFPGIDIKGDGGLAVAPPSVFGAAGYSWN